MNLKLEGKVAIVTGSEPRARPRQRDGARRGRAARVTICARGPERLNEAAAEPPVGRLSQTRLTVLVAIAADLSTPDGVEHGRGRTVAAFGGLDILVNNVGLARGTTHRRDDATRSGRRRSTRRSFRRSAPRAWPCRTCGGAAAARSS